MVTIGIDGTRYPCHRFLPLSTGRPTLESSTVNKQKSWEPSECANCKLVISCPTCIGFNYQENGNQRLRTAYHCEAHKIGILASCKLEALRLSQMKKSDFDELTDEEKNKRIRRLDAVINIIENGL